VNLAAPFEAVGDHIGAALGPARVLFTTRRGGVSTGAYQSLNLGLLTDDDREDVRVNRDRVASVVGAPWERFARGRQVHGAEVRRVTVAPAGEPPAPADGQATALPCVPAIVLTADCLPIALASDDAVAMIHAGWRGLAAGIVEEGVAALREQGAGERVRAAIGPAAGVCCYEVGEEVHAVFADEGPDVRAGRHLDMKLIARRRLEAAGVEDVLETGLCTMCAPPELFFSHRRDGGVTGRQGGIVWRP
jgi:purine-nucleoside/S-methyl-5'-thioadenosine phosphorylase / adenosine deaminase